MTQVSIALLGASFPDEPRIEDFPSSQKIKVVRFGYVFPGYPRHFDISVIPEHQEEIDAQKTRAETVQDLATIADLIPEFIELRQRGALAPAIVYVNTGEEYSMYEGATNQRGSTLREAAEKIKTTSLEKL